MTAPSLIYLYGIVPADAPEPPRDLVGLEERPVRLLRGGGVAAVISDLPAAGYTEDELNTHLGDLRWVGERGIAHERVLTWFSDQGPTVPLAPFSLHQDTNRVRSRLEEDASRFHTVLERLRGRREWGIKLWRVDARLAAHLNELSSRLAALAAEIERAAPGRQFLLGKKRDAMVAEERRVVGARIARQVFATLREPAADGLPLPLAAPSEDDERVLVLHAAFLVDGDTFPEFQQRVTEAVHEYGPRGFDLEFTGPWPPYHFAGIDDSRTR